MSDLLSEIGMTKTHMARTSYRAFCHASGSGGVDFEELSQERMLAWRRAVSKFLAMFDSFVEGRPIKDVTQEVIAAYHGDAPFTQPTAMSLIYWEAVVRHLWHLCEEGGSDDLLLPDLEASWRAWASGQLAKRAANLQTLTRE